MSPRSVSDILEALADHSARLAVIERTLSGFIQFVGYAIAGPLWVGLLLLIASKVVG